jgi:hypothetical protein
VLENTLLVPARDGLEKVQDSTFSKAC